MLQQNSQITFTVIEFRTLRLVYDKNDASDSIHMKVILH